MARDPKDDLHEYDEKVVGIDEGRRKRTGNALLQQVRILEPREIPHRQWLYGHHVIRGFMTLLVAPGGTGKTSLLLATLLAIATKRALLGVMPYLQSNVGLLNLEDPAEEIDRRVTALAMHYGLKQDDIEGKFFQSPPDATVTVAAIGDDGFTVIHPDEDRIIQFCQDLKIGVLGVDPFAESHTLEENSNPQMIKAAAAWRRIARKAGCAIIASHHVRKGVIDSIEASRGAKALTDSARIGLLLSGMSEEDAQSLGIEGNDRHQYIRMDDAKANMAPKAGSARWFRLGSVTLDNADEVYQFGDEVGVVEPWTPATIWQQTPTTDINAALDLIQIGPGGGRKYTPTRQGGSSRWCGNVLIKHLGVIEPVAKQMVNTWLRNGLLIVTEYHDPDKREMKPCVEVNDAKRPG
jgi:AAA domain-containing protein